MTLEAPVAPATTTSVDGATELLSTAKDAPGDSLPTSIEAPGDATYGWAMFVAFTAAVVGISIVVCVLALIGSWLMLGIAIAVHVGITATMMKLVLGAFGSEDHAYPDGRAAEAASRAALAGATPAAPVI